MTFKYDLSGGVKKAKESCSGDYTLNLNYRCSGHR